MLHEEAPHHICYIPELAESSRLQLWACSSVLIHIMTLHETSHCLRESCANIGSFKINVMPWQFVGQPGPYDPQFVQRKCRITLNFISYLPDCWLCLQLPNCRDSSHRTRNHLQRAKFIVLMIKIHVLRYHDRSQDQSCNTIRKQENILILLSKSSYK